MRILRKVRRDRQAGDRKWQTQDLIHALVTSRAISSVRGYSDLNTFGPSVDLTKSPRAIAPTNEDSRAFSPRSSDAYDKVIRRLVPDAASILLGCALSCTQEVTLNIPHLPRCSYSARQFEGNTLFACKGCSSTYDGQADGDALLMDAIGQED